MEPSDVLLCPAMPPTTDTPLPLVMFREPIRDRQVDNICPLRVNWPSNTHFVMPAAPCPSPRPPARGWATRSPTTRAFIRRSRSRIFLLGAAGEQEENGLGASASGAGADPDPKCPPRQ